MAFPTAVGKYIATIGQKAIGEHNNKTIFECEYHLESMPDYPDHPCAGQFLKARHYLERNDGGINIATIDMLKAAFNWNGADVFWLEDSDFTGHKVSVVVNQNPSQDGGRMYWNIDFVNPVGGSGRALEKSSADMRSRISARIASKMRANAGGAASQPARVASPADNITGPLSPQAGQAMQAAAASQPAPVQPAAPAQPVAPVAANAGPSNSNECWELLNKAMSGAQKADIESAWWELLDTMDPEKMTANEWGSVAAQIRTKFPAVA